MLNWAIDNGLEISQKLSMNYTDDNTRNFYLNEDVEQNETILEIPVKLTITSGSIMEYFKKNKIIKKLHKSINPDGNIKLNEDKDFKLDEAFIAGVLYLVNEYPKKYGKSKFSKFYSPYFDNFEKNVDNFPYFYTKEQRELFSFTSFGGLFKVADDMVNEAAKYLTDVLKKDIDIDSYAKYKVYVSSKGVNIGQKFTMVPFVDLFYKNAFNYNLNVSYNEEKETIRVFTIKSVSEDEKLCLPIANAPNINTLLTYGVTQDETIDNIQQFNIPAILSEFLDSKGYNKNQANLNAQVELTNNKFYEKVIDVYKSYLEKINKEANDITALELFKENLEYLRKRYNSINYSTINKIFVGKKNIENAMRLIEGEKRFVDKKIKKLTKVINNRKKKLSKQKNKNKKDL